MKIKLSKLQQEYYPAIKWLINDGPRASGRTTLLAVAFLEKAVETPGRKILVFDHFPIVRSVRDNMLDRVKALFEIQSPEFKKTYELKIYKFDLSISIDFKSPKP